jgi:hypothetical protein
MNCTRFCTPIEPKKHLRIFRKQKGEKGDVRAERSKLFDKIINVRLLPGCDKSSHTGVGHT